MDLVLVGLDHHVAPLDVRERLAVSKDAVGPLLGKIHEHAWAEEAMLVATCNRTELYVVSRDAGGADLAIDALKLCLPGAADIDRELFRVREDETAARHLFRVAAGLESAILGETEIQGQVRDGYEAAKAAGTVGKFLDRLARGALRAGKRARNETRISSGGLSLGNAATRVAQRIFGSVEGREILVVGAGDMARQSALALGSTGQGAPRFRIANRTCDHAEALAADLPNAEVLGLDEVPGRLTKAHVVVLAGGAVALDEPTLARAIPRRREPLLVVDLCVPRAAEPSIAQLPGVFLYHLDALEELVAASLAGRHEAVGEVETILAQEYGEFRAWSRTLEALPAIQSMQAWAESLRAKAVSHLPEQVSGEVRDAVDELTKRLVKKLLARPTARVVKGMEQEDPSMPTPDHLRSVFGLHETENESS